MGETITFDVVPIEETPARKYTKKSKYDPVIDAFIASGNATAEIKIQKKDSKEYLEANYIRTQLAKRITTRELTTVKVNVINDRCFMRTTDSTED